METLFGGYFKWNAGFWKCRKCFGCGTCGRYTADGRSGKNRKGKKTEPETTPEDEQTEIPEVPEEDQVTEPEEDAEEEEIRKTISLNRRNSRWMSLKIGKYRRLWKRFCPGRQRRIEQMLHPLMRLLPRVPVIGRIQVWKTRSWNC